MNDGDRFLIAVAFALIAFLILGLWDGQREIQELINSVCK